MAAAPRKWLAALLSLLVPGTGQLYAASPKRAVFFLAAFGVGVLLAAYALLTITASFGILAALALSFGVAVAVAVDAWRMAGRWPAGSIRPASSRWFVVLPAFLAGGVAISAGNEWRKEHLVQAFRVPSNSMDSTLLAGDFVIADKRSAAREPRHGALLVHESVEDSGLMVIKRAVAMPGDTIEMRRGVFRLNGQLVDEPYLYPGNQLAFADPPQRQRMKAWQLPHLLRPDSLYYPNVSDWGPLVVPADSYFALGDNRHFSYDSRYYGFVPFARVRGRALYIYLSRDPEAGFRWARLGKRVH